MIILIFVLSFFLMNNHNNPKPQFSELSKISLVHVSQEFHDSFCVFNPSQYLLIEYNDKNKIIVTGAEIKNIKIKQGVYQIQTGLSKGGGIGVNCSIYLLNNVNGKIEVKSNKGKNFIDYTSDKVNEYKKELTRQYQEVYKNK